MRRKAEALVRLVAVFGNPASSIPAVCLIGAILCAAALGLATSAGAAETPPFLALSGQASVLADSGFSYRLPLVLPPGNAGLSPAVALVYNSRGTDGPLGLAWSLELSAAGRPSPAIRTAGGAALPAASTVGSTSSSPAAGDTAGDVGGASTNGALAPLYPTAAGFELPVPLTRCPRTIAQDGVHGGVNFDANDRFCLNGKRLILVSGTYGADGSQYHYEIDDFTLVTAHGQSGSGPTWFQVQTRDGLTYQFGNTTDSRAPLVPVPGSTTGPTGTVRAWGLNRIGDPQGNYLTVTYNNGTPDSVNGQLYPTEIDYSGNTAASPAVSPYNHIYFYYNTTQVRADIVPSYQAGSLVQGTVLLNEIKVYNTSSLVYDYKLSYTLATNGAQHDELASLTLCDPAASCLPSVSFAWQGSRDRLTMTGTSLTLPGVAAPSGSYGGTLNSNSINIAAADFNGDGLTDFVIVPSGTGSNYTVNTYLGTTTLGQFGSPVTSYLPSGGTNLPFRLTQLDVNADGIMDLFYQQPNCTGNSARFSISSGTGTFNTPNSVSCWDGNEQIALTPGADYNGDGYADYMSNTLVSTGHVGALYVGSGSGTFSQFGASIPFGIGYQAIFSEDFDGDGCADLIYVSAAAQQVSYGCHPAVPSVALPTGIQNGLGATLGNHPPPPGQAQNNQVLFCDFNGDGKVDVLVILQGQPAVLYLSTGTGFAAGLTISNSTSWYEFNVAAADWNGDGKADLLLVSPNNGFGGVGTAHQLWLSTGTGFEQALNSSGTLVTIPNTSSSDACTSVAFYPCIIPEIADWNNDGAQDILLIRASGPEIYSFAYVPELVTAVSNGIGGTVTATYDRINKNGSFYTKCPNNPGSTSCGDAYPVQAVDAAYYVVSRIDRSNGLGVCTPPASPNCYTLTYSYGGLKRDLSGRGMLGFQQQTETDTETGLVTASTFRTDFPYIGYRSVLARSTTATSTGCASNVTIETDADTAGSVNLGGTRSFVYTSSKAQHFNDCNGAPLPTLMWTFQYDCQGGPTCYGDLDVQSLSRSDGSSWTETLTYSDDTTDWCFDRPVGDVVGSTVGSSSITRTTSNAWTKCLLATSTIEPSIPALTVATNFTSDVFGNVTAQATSGSTFSSRSLAFTFDPNGQFETTRTNELGYVDHYTADARFGLRTSHTDPNSVVEAWAFDTFGRLSSETHADGTKAALTYSYCRGTFGGTATCPTNGTYVASRLPTASNGTTQIGPQSSVYFDALMRSIANDTQGFDGSTIRVLRPFDALGRQASVTRPYFAATGTPESTTYTYDALGRVIRAVAPNGGVTTTTYNGLTVSIQNANSQVTATTKNAEGMIASITDAIMATTAYSYDAFNDLTSIADVAGNSTSFTYDARGHRLSSRDPDLGAWSFSYDGLGQRLSQSDAKSQTTTYSYDLEGRLIRRTESDLTSTWTYDTAINGVGRLAAAYTAAGTQRSFTYDAVSRPIQVALTVGGNVYNYHQAYGASNGKLSTLTYPSGYELGYSYNTYGYVSTIADIAAGASVWVIGNRDAELHLTQQTFGNGVQQTNTYDPQTGNLLSISAGSNSSIVSLSYSYDLIGNTLTRADAVNVVSESFCFDALNRVTNGATGVGGVVPRLCTSTGGNIITKMFTYDALGDIITKSDVGTYAYPGAGQAHPHAVQSIAGVVNGVTNPNYAYDLNGNLTAGAGRTLTYTSFNMTLGISQAASNYSFTYDTEHQRVIQVLPSSTIAYLNDPVSGAKAELNTSGPATTWSDYVSVPLDEAGASGLLAEHIAPSGVPALWGSPNWLAFSWGAPASTSYMIVDALGSTAAVTASGGAASERDSFDVWGRRRNPNGTDNQACVVSSSTSRGFTDHEMLDPICLINMNARVYDQTIGRFFSPDLKVQDIYQPQYLNHYTYADNDPLDKTDPKGTDAAAAAAVLSNVGKLDLGEEVVGGGLGDPVADAAVAVTTVGGLIYAGYKLFQPPDANGPTTSEARSKPGGPDPDADGRPHSIPDGRGGYTTYGPRDPITGQPESTKQYRPAPGKPHGPVERPNVKDRPAATRPDGAKVPGKPVVRPPEPGEAPQPPQQPPPKPPGS